MVVNRRDLERKFTRQDESRIEELEGILDKALLDRWEPSMARFSVTISGGVREKVQLELQRRYAEHGWRLSFRHHDDQRDGAFDEAIFEPLEREEDRR